MKNQASVPVVSSQRSLPGFGQLFLETRDLYRKRFGTATGIMAVAGVLALVLLAVFGGVGWLLLSGAGGFEKVLGTMLQQSTGLSTMMLALIVGYVLFLCILSILVSLWLSAFLTFLRSESTTPIGILESYREGGKKFLSVWWVYLLTIGMSIGSFLFFVIPGIALGVFLMFGLFVVMLDDIKGFGALSASYHLVRGAWWKVFGRLFLLGLVMFLWVFVLGIVLGFITPLVVGALPNPTIITVLLTALVQLLTWFFLVPFMTIFSSRLYAALKASKPLDASRKPSTLFRVMGIIFILVALGYAIAYPWFAVTSFGNLQESFSPQASAETPEEMRVVSEEDLAGFPDDHEFFTQYESKEEGQRFSLAMPKRWQASSFVTIHTLERNDSNVQFKIEQDFVSGKTPEERAKDSLTLYQDYLKGGEPFEQQDLMIGGKPAYAYSIRFATFGIPIQYTLYHVVVDENTSYKITASTVYGDAEFYTPVFQKMIESLVFTD